MCRVWIELCKIDFLPILRGDTQNSPINTGEILHGGNLSYIHVYMEEILCESIYAKPLLYTCVYGNWFINSIER